MVSFNKTLTETEAIKLFQFKGATIYPDTQHNRQLMAEIAHKYLLTLKK